MAKSAKHCEGLGGVGPWLSREHDADNAKHYAHYAKHLSAAAGGGGRGFHSSASQLNLSRFVIEIIQCNPQKCSRQAEKWTSVSPWAAAR